MPKKPSSPKTIETFTHIDEKRKNIPTAEHQAVLDEEQKKPRQIRYPRNTDLDPQLAWRGKDEQDWSDLVVHAPPLYIQEKIHPKALVDDLLRQSKAAAPVAQFDLFHDFNGIPHGVEKTDFYQHDQNWTNRMLLGDSLQVMASLAEREGLRGKVQCIYFDPPYGIKFNSNFQWSTTSRDVKDGKADHITREPEQVKAFRDTWRDGIHSYLTYLRDRLTVARDLLTESGSIFVQIGDENVHRVRAVMDEVFGDSGCVSTINFATTSAFSTVGLSNSCDYVLWYCRDLSRIKYRSLWKTKALGAEKSGKYVYWDDDFGSRFTLTREEKDDPSLIPEGREIYAIDNLSSQGWSPKTSAPFGFEGTEYSVGNNAHWKTTTEGLARLTKANRLVPLGRALMYKRRLSDFSVFPLNNQWTDSASGASQADPKVYVVQTRRAIVERCLLMTTDPGDLVLDPTCGSGTTATVAEQWGRRWITIDTSRVALALARARIMGARYPFYLLADSREGQIKEAEVTRTATSSQAVHGNIRHGFVYERVPHIMLSSISSNAEIDVIWDKWEEQLKPLREKFSEFSLKFSGGSVPEEWEIPREAPSNWPQATQPLLTAFWEARIARQKEIDASIAAKAEFEYLYDQPYEDKKKVRVAGPFTVESLSPHRVLGVDENDGLIDPLRMQESSPAYGMRTFEQMILENLKAAGVQQAHKEDRIQFLSLTGWPGEFICAEGRYEASDERPVASDLSQATDHLPQTTIRRAGIFIGPEFGTVTRPDLVDAAREAGDAGFDVLIACAFNYEAHAGEFHKLGRIPVLKARMNADLHMADDLKTTGKGNLFVIFGEPDIEVASGLWLVTRNGRKVANYEHTQELSGLGSLEEINRLGGTDLPGFKKLSARGALRPHEPNAAGVCLGAIEHRGGSGQDGNRGISSEPECGERLAGGNGNADSHRPPLGNASANRDAKSAVAGGGNQQNAGRAQALAGIETLTPADFPLSLTTSHYSQVTVHGVDVFDPSTGEVRSDSAEGIACWFLDTDYNGESFFVRHAYFLGQNDPYTSLKTTLKAEIDPEAWSTLHSDTSRPFEKPKSGRIAVKVINHLGDEVMKVFKV